MLTGLMEQRPEDRAGDVVAEYALSSSRNIPGRFVAFEILRDWHLVEDVHSETCLVMAEKVEHQAEIKGFWQLHRGIMHHKSVDIRRKKRPGALPERFDIQDNKSTSPEHAIHIMDEYHRVIRIIEKILNPRQFGVFRLSCEEEKSYEEIAKLMDIPVNTVKTTLHRARTKLEAQWNRSDP